MSAQKIVVPGARFALFFVLFMHIDTADKSQWHDFNALMAGAAAVVGWIPRERTEK